jgi:hypothetical protein
MKRRILAGAFFGVILCMMTGCLTEREKADLRADGERIRKQVEAATAKVLEAQQTIADVAAKIKAGEMGVAEGSAVIDAARLQAEFWKSQAADGRELYAGIREKLEGKGILGTLEGLITLAITALTGAGGGLALTRYSRGPSSRNYKNPDGSIRTG